MTLQDKLEEIKDKVAVKHEYNDWEHFLEVCLRLLDFPTQELLQLENEAMIAFASYCCERQRDSDAKSMKYKEQILNNPLITDEL